jgi:hypothetical protein
MKKESTFPEKRGRAKTNRGTERKIKKEQISNWNRALGSRKNDFVENSEREKERD